MDIGRSSSKSCNSSSSGRSSSQLINAKIQQHRLRHCPSCGYQIPQQEWPGVPAGVKFEPSDQELILHLRAKAGLDGSDAAHPLLDEFIPTLHGLDGICSAHPERLPGVSRDGASAHFFHRPSKAYTTGNRKRRKIILHSGAGHSDGPSPAPAADTRWHKTGKTRPVFVQGRQLGCKKILVLYTNFGKHCKPHKTSWVMHQYHLGLQDDEKHGELVVSKIFFQTNPRHSQSLSAADAVAQQEMKLKSSTSASLRMNNNSSQSQSQSQGSDDFSGFGSSGGSEDTLTLARPHSPSNQHRHSNSRGRLLFCEETLVEDDEEQEHDEDEQQTIQTQTHLQSSPIFPDYDYEAAVSPANTSTTIDDAAAWVHTQTETSAADPQSNPKEECRIQQNREEGEAHDWLLYSYCWPESEPEQHQQHSSSFLI